MPLDRARVDRARRAGAGDHARADEPLREPGTLGLRGAPARHDARTVRWTPRNGRRPRRPARMIVVLMGGSGAGKTTIGEVLAQRPGRTFIGGDDYPPRREVRKVRAGRPPPA